MSHSVSCNLSKVKNILKKNSNCCYPFLSAPGICLKYYGIVLSLSLFFCVVLSVNAFAKCESEPAVSSLVLRCQYKECKVIKKMVIPTRCADSRYANHYDPTVDDISIGQQLLLEKDIHSSSLVIFKCDFDSLYDYLRQKKECEASLIPLREQAEGKLIYEATELFKKINGMPTEEEELLDNFYGWVMFLTPVVFCLMVVMVVFLRARKKLNLLAGTKDTIKVQIFKLYSFDKKKVLQFYPHEEKNVAKISSLKRWMIFWPVLALFYVIGMVILRYYFADGIVVL